MVEYILTDLDDNILDTGYKQTKTMQNVKRRKKRLITKFIDNTTQHIYITKHYKLIVVIY